VTGGGPRGEAQAAFDARSWARAYELFVHADRDGELDADDLERLAV
jgi:hypothetical protein